MRVAVGLHAALLRGRAASAFSPPRSWTPKERIRRGRHVGMCKTQVPAIEHADVRRQLLAQKALSEGGYTMCFAVGRSSTPQKRTRRPPRCWTC